MATIVAIDLGKYKSVACIYQDGDVEPAFQTVQTLPGVLHDLIVAIEPARGVNEIGAAAGWLKDPCEAMVVPNEAAELNPEARRWKQTGRKTDRDEALKPARLGAMGELRTCRAMLRDGTTWREPAMN